MCKGKKCLGKNETNKLNFLERKWHRKSDIINHVDEIYFSLPTLLQIYTQAHHGKCVKIDVWSLFQSCEKEIKNKNSIDNLKKNGDLLPTPGLFPSCLHARGTFLPSFFVPTLGDLTTQESPPPGICYQAKKKLLMPGNQRGGGGGWCLGLEGSWAQLELTDAWCNILMIHSISVVAIRTVWVLILNFVTHLL